MSITTLDLWSSFIFHHFTFFAWQYSFSITFPRTHGRLEVPVAAKMQQSSTLDKDSLHTPFIYIIAGIEDKPLFQDDLCTFRIWRLGEKSKFNELNSDFFFFLHLLANKVAPLWQMSDLVWGPVQWETLSGGSRGWDPLWTARSCHAFHPGWLGPNRLPGNWGTKKKTRWTRRHWTP